MAGRSLCYQVGFSYRRRILLAAKPVRCSAAGLPNTARGLAALTWLICPQLQISPDAEILMQSHLERGNIQRVLGIRVASLPRIDIR
jgi:hypothetical protein